jgi:microcystin-dependent protein
MAQPYVGEIRIFAGNFAPQGWMFCEGQSLAISEYETLFNLIGTTYGGDGQETFLLPDLQGRVPVHVGNGISLAEAGGVENVTLTTQQIPSHNHTLLGSSLIANDPNPTNNVLGESSAISMYQSATPTAAMAPPSIGPVGGSQPHTNFQPYLCVNFIISLYGIFPSQN